MEQSRFVYEHVTSLTAVAVGQPGHRTFYLVAGDEISWVKVWLDKQELESLSSVLEEMLGTIVEGGHQPPLKDDERTPEMLFEPSYSPASEFGLRQMAVGYDESRDKVGLFVYEQEDNNDSPKLICWITRPQAITLSQKIDEVCGAGRPICNLCGGPIDPEGHVCPKSNGHRPITL